MKLYGKYSRQWRVVVMVVVTGMGGNSINGGGWKKNRIWKVIGVDLLGVVCVCVCM